MRTRTRSAARPRPGLEVLEGRLLLATYYVGPGGADGNPGTLTRPFATIQKGLDSAARPGDTVAVRSGTYHEKIHFPHAGTAGGWITLRADPGDRPILDGRGVAGADMVAIHDRSYVRLIGFEIRDDLGVDDGSGVRVTGSGTAIQILNNVIHDIRGVSAMGITVYGTDRAPIADLLVAGNRIYDCQPSPSEALTINGNVTRFNVIGNDVHDVNNIGIVAIGGERDVNPFGLVARDGVIRGNHVARAHSNYGGGYAGGIYVDGGKDIVVERNLSEQNDLGIEVGAENPGVVASGIVVRNNLIVANAKSGLVFGGYDADRGRVNNSTFIENTIVGNDTLRGGFAQVVIAYAAGNLVANNIIVATSEPILLDSAGAGNVRNRLDFNLYEAPGGAGPAVFHWNDATYTGFADFRRGTGQEAHGRFADPRFVAAAAHNYHLAAGSPAIGTGRSCPSWAASTDFDGRPRPPGRPADLGAFAFVQPPAPRHRARR